MDENKFREPFWKNLLHTCGTGFLRITDATKKWPDSDKAKVDCMERHEIYLNESDLLHRVKIAVVSFEIEKSQHLAQFIASCIRACAGMDDPEKELTERDAEIKKLAEALLHEGLKVANREVIINDFRRMLAERDAEIARLKAEGDMLENAVSTARNLAGLGMDLLLGKLDQIYAFIMGAESERNSELQSDNAALRAVLEKHEWARQNMNGLHYCHICKSFKYIGHTPGCEIARLLHGNTNPPDGEGENRG